VQTTARASECPPLHCKSHCSPQLSSQQEPFYILTWHTCSWSLSKGLMSAAKLVSIGSRSGRTSNPIAQTRVFITTFTGWRESQVAYTPHSLSMFGSWLCGSAYLETFWWEVLLIHCADWPSHDHDAGKKPLIGHLSSHFIDNQLSCD